MIFRSKSFTFCNDVLLRNCLEYRYYQAMEHAACLQTGNVFFGGVRIMVFDFDKLNEKPPELD